MTVRNKLLPARISTPAQVRQKINALRQKKGGITEAEGEKTDGQATRSKGKGCLISERENNAVIESLFQYLRQLDRDFLYATSSRQNLAEIYAEYRERKTEAEQALQAWSDFVNPTYTGPPRRQDPAIEARIQGIIEILER